jgi:glycosyltransferase involved in cell wall biosynthesis
MENIGNPLISVVVPVFNRHENLIQTLNSLSSQTLRPLELILVDNASTDDSLEICNKFKETHQSENLFIQVLSEFKPGANAARNKGLKAANGDYLYFFDSDDIIYPHSIETIYINLYKNNFPEAIAFPFTIKFANGKKTKRPHRYSSDPACQLFDTVIPTHGICFRRTLIEKIGLWDNNLSRWQDLEFGFRIMLNIEKLHWIKGEPLYEANMHEESISGKSYSEDHEKLFSTVMKIQSIIDKMPSGNKTDRIQRALCFKICSLASMIKLEKNKDLGLHYFRLALEKLPHARKKTSIFILRFHYLYSGLGGRGFWRLAEKIL